MKFPTIILGCALALLGIPLGYCAKTAFMRTTSENQVTEVGGGMPGLKSPSTRLAASDEIPQLVTGETLESLVAQGDGVSYAALSLWLLDADSDEIAAFWANFQKGAPGDDLKNLLFINWTRLDPLAAIDAVKGTDNERIAWWAWAAHDPATAMAAASPNMRKHVARGAGEFNPGWVRKNFDSIPKDVRAIAIQGVMTWEDDEDHAATMDFLVAHGRFSEEILETFARKNPWGAYDWLVKNDRLKASEFGGEIYDLISVMKNQHPDDLERMAEMTPSGRVKWMMEDALFENLLARDPEKALEKARQGKAPLVNAKRLVAIGISLLTTDPEKAFELGGEIFSMTNGKFDPTVKVMWDGGVMQTSTYNGDAAQFIDGLLEKDPYRTLEIAAASSAGGNSGTFRNLSSTVADKDLDGYAAWVNRLTDPNSRAQGSVVVASKLTQKGHFNEASEWALSGYDPEGGFPYEMSSMLELWSGKDSEMANAWLDSAPISEDHRKTMNSNLKGSHR